MARPLKELETEILSDPVRRTRVEARTAEIRRELDRFERNPLRRIAYSVRRRWELRGL